MKNVRNEEAVSPVIGVILMVAITVILAAVIAAFVFNIGGTQQKTPVASLTAVTGSSSSGNISITHTGGDAIDLSKVKAIVEQGTSRNSIAQLNTSSQVIYTGDKIVIKEATNVALYINNVNSPNLGTSTGNFSLASGLVTITLIDTDTSQQIATLKTTVT